MIFRISDQKNHIVSHHLFLENYIVISIFISLLPTFIFFIAIYSLYLMLLFNRPVYYNPIEAVYHTVYFPSFPYRFFLPRSIISFIDFFPIPSVPSLPTIFSYKISPSMFPPSIVVFYRYDYFTVPSISPAKNCFKNVSTSNVFFSRVFPLHNNFSSSDFLQ